MLASVKISLIETLDIMSKDLGVEIEIVGDGVVIWADALIGGEHDKAADCGDNCRSCLRWRALSSWADETIGAMVEVLVSGQRKPSVPRISFSPAAILVEELRRHGWPDKTTREEQKRSAARLSEEYDRASKKREMKASPCTRHCCR